MDPQVPTAREKTLSVVSPVFNNAGSLAELVDRLIAVCEICLPHYQLEIILVDDASFDDSVSVIRSQLAKGGSSVKIRLVRLSRNFGQVSAIAAGLAVSNGDACVVISADLQDPPELIAQLVEKWETGSEVVIAARSERNDGVSASIFSRASYFVARRRYSDMPRGGFDFFLLSRRAVDQFVTKPGRKRFLQGEVFELGFSRSVVCYERGIRPVGKSQWRFWKRVEYFIDLVLASTNVPMRAATLLGFVSVLASTIYALVVVLSRVFGVVPGSGWTPVVLLILFFGGLTIFLLGLVGEYIWRIYEETSGKRQYLIEVEQSSDQFKRG